jgi:glycosyltransferase 2 family protein
MKSDFGQLVRKTEPFLKVALPSALIVFIGHTVIKDWDIIRQSITRSSFIWAGPALVCFFLSVATIAINWKSLLAVLGVRYSFFNCMKTFFYSMLIKYVPGKIWGVTGRIVLSRPDGIPEGTNALSIILESLFLMVSASLVGLPALAVFHSMPAEIRIIMLLSPFVLLFLHPSMIQWAVKILARRFPAYVIAPDSVPGYKTMIILLLRYSMVWIFQGLGFWFCLKMIHELPWNSLWIAITGNCLAWLVGFLAVFTPAGLGVREFVLARFTSGIIPAGPGAMAAILSRFFIILCELITASVFYVTALVTKKRREKMNRV